MAKAIWNGKVIAESETTEVVEGNVYFPETSLKREYFRPSSTTSTCPWKGQASYYSVQVGEETYYIHFASGEVQWWLVEVILPG